MQQFLQIIHAPNPSLYFLENKIVLSPAELQQFYNWLNQKSESCETSDIKALAHCRMNGAAHNINSYSLTSSPLPASFPQNNTIQMIAKLCQENNQDVFLIGGCVRDLLLGKEFFDIDCCLENAPDAFVDALIKEHGGRYDKASNFGAIHWHTLSGDTIDFTQTRKEVYPQKGHLPEITPSDLATDLLRRDFTINAMAIPLHPDRQEELLDPFQGRADLNNKTLRILHPLSFWDDPTRIFRGARYSGRYELQCSRMTRLGLDFALEDIILGEDISWQRIGNELKLIFWENKPALAWKVLQDWGVLHQWFPSWSNILPLIQRLQDDYPLPPTVEKLHSYWAILSLSLSLEERKHQVGMVSQRPVLRKLWLETPIFLDKLRQNPEALTDRGFFAEIVHKASLSQIFVISLFLPEIQDLFNWWKAEGHQIHCKIGGKDLLALGCPKGPLIGRALAAAKRGAWNGLDENEQLQEAQKVWLTSY